MAVGLVALVAALLPGARHAGRRPVTLLLMPSAAIRDQYNSVCSGLSPRGPPVALLQKGSAARRQARARGQLRRRACPQPAAAIRPQHAVHGAVQRKRAQRRARFSWLVAVFVIHRSTPPCQGQPPMAATPDAPRLFTSAMFAVRSAVFASWPWPSSPAQPGSDTNPNNPACQPCPAVPWPCPSIPPP